MSTVTAETRGDVASKNEMTSVRAAALLGVAGVAITGFWVFALFVIIPAIFAR